MGGLDQGALRAGFGGPVAEGRLRTQFWHQFLLLNTRAPIINLKYRYIHSVHRFDDEVDQIGGAPHDRRLCEDRSGNTIRSGTGRRESALPLLPCRYCAAHTKAGGRCRIISPRMPVISFTREGSNKGNRRLELKDDPGRDYCFRGTPRRQG